MINFDFALEVIRETFRQEQRLERLGPGLYTCRDNYLWHFPEPLAEFPTEAEIEAEAEREIFRGDFGDLHSPEALASVIDAERERRKYGK